VAGIGADERFHAPLTGVRLGRYLLGDRLGAGGAASVYLAQLRGPHDFERLLAVKVVHEHLTESSDFVNMFLDEANLAVRLTHPCIVHSYELGRDGPYLFLAMEYLNGQPLSKLMARAKSLGQRLDPRMVAWVGARAAEGLAYAHALTDESGKRVSLVHRDVSPQNLFLTYDGHVKVIDFGIAHAEGRLTHTGLGRIKGKFSYMAPEQMLKQSVDHRADLFALGATLYEAAVGERPFQAEDEAEAIAMLLEETAPKPEARVPGFPERLSNILCHALEREPEDRYEGAAELARDLDEYVRESGAPGVEADLARLMTSSFAAEREEQANAISKLRALGVGTPREQAGRTTTADPMATSILPLPRKFRRRWTIAGVVFAALAALGGAATLVQRTGAANTEQTRSQTVTFEISVEPDVPATVTVGGVVAGGRPAHALVQRGSSSVAIQVDASGFESTQLTALPDRDRLIAVRLVPKPTEPAAAPSAPLAAEVVPAAPRAERPVPAQARSKGAAPREPAAAPAPGGANKKRKDSLVTDYPF
jgi:serine/threonine-protein kinase